MKPAQSQTYNKLLTRTVLELKTETSALNIK